MQWYWQHFLGDDGGRATSLEARAGSAPAYVLTAGFDQLRDEGRTNADALEAAGMAVVRAEQAGQIHGFVRMTAVMCAARPAPHDIGASLRGHLGGVRPDAPGQRSSRKKARTSSTSSCGCSSAAKWPPLGMTVQRRRANASSTQCLGGR